MAKHRYSVRAVININHFDTNFYFIRSCDEVDCFDKIAKRLGKNFGCCTNYIKTITIREDSKVIFEGNYDALRQIVGN